MSKPSPTGKEREFSADQMFFSRTDPSGIIRFGNSVFVKISGYTSEQLVGAPHNIIRHPDMPRIVFKLLWDYLKAGKPIVAYVKNLAVTGEHYWVLAAAYPVADGYLSIRIKPTTALLPKVADLYKEVLEVEKKAGMDAAGEFLMKSLKDSGFKTYDDFMIHAAFSELKALDQLLVSENKFAGTQVQIAENENIRSSRDITSQIELLSTELTSKFHHLFGVLDNFGKSSSLFQDRVSMILEEFEDLKRISLNLRVLASNFGQKGNALSVIAAEFQKVASDIELHMKSFSRTIQSASESMQKSIFDISSIKLQTDMVDTFVQESLEQVHAGTLSAVEAFEALEKNGEIFSRLCSQSSSAALSRLIDLQKELRVLEQASIEVKKFINALEVIEKLAAVEAGREDSLRQAIQGGLERLSEFTAQLRRSMQEISPTLRSLVEDIKSLTENLQITAKGLDQIFLLARAV